MIARDREMTSNLLQTSTIADAQGTDRAEAELPGVADCADMRSALARHRFVPQLVADRAATMPDAVAVVAGTDLITYQELDARANRLGNYLRLQGVGPDVVVGLCLERSIDVVVGALAVLKAGGAYLPLDPAHPAERLHFMLADAQVPVLVTRQGIADQLIAGAWRTVCVDTDRAAIAAQPAQAPESTVHAGTLAYVIYTSGSTGEPKGVELTHGGLLNLVFWHRDAFAVTPTDRATQIASLAFDAAVWELWPYLTAGASISVPDEETRLSPELLRDWLVARGVTLCFLPTPLAEIAITLEWPVTTALRAMLTGGDRLHNYPPATLPFALINNYGPAEGTVVATSGRVLPTEAPHSLPSIGRPIANTQVSILDEALQPAPVGMEGELYIGGIGVARGYHNRPALTAERFIPNPFDATPGSRLYKTGDLARYLPDGSIDFIGRSDGQVKIRGNRIEIGEIITVLNRHPAVRASHVAAREHRAGDMRLVAYVVPASGYEPTADDLHGFLRTHLPEYMVPAAFVRIEALPVTPNGKIDPAALPEPDAANSMWEASDNGPRTAIEGRIAEIVATVLGLPRVGMDDDFFLLGGHSLLGIQLISRIRDTFAVELPLLSLFEAPTVAELSDKVEQLIVANLEAMSEEEAQRILA
jgi:amino acid adenylation domain-containing protein